MDQSSFEDRVRALWPAMVRAAACVVRNRSDAEDAAAQAVFNCWRALPRLRREELFDSWVLRACVNEARMTLRRRRRIDLREDFSDLRAEAPQTTRSLRPLILRLPEKDALALTLMYYEDYSVDRIAAVLGVPRGTAASRISRARKKLKVILEQEGYPNE